MALAAGADIAADGAQLHVNDITLEQALILSEEETKTLQVVLSPSEHGYEFRILSQNDESYWISHVSGQLVIDPDEQDPSPVDLASLQSQCADEIDIVEHYRMVHERGVHYGPGFQGMQQLFQGNAMALGEIELPESLAGADNANANDKYHLHPALFDASLQVLGKAISRTSDSTHMPIGLKELRVYRHGVTRVWSFVRLVEQSEEKVITDVLLFDESGALIAELKGFEMGRVSEETLMHHFRKKSDDLYEIVWQKQALDTIERAHDDADGSWLVLADQGGMGQKLARKLEQAGNRCILAYAGSGASDDGAWHLDPSSPGDFQTFLNDAFTEESPPLKGIVHLWSLDASDSDELTNETLTQAQTMVCGSVLHLVQATTDHGQSPRLWLVTRNAISTGSMSACLAVSQAPLWGLGKVIAMEHPELRCAQIDLDPSTGTIANVDALLEEFRVDGREDQIAWRDNDRYVARLMPHGSGAKQDVLEVPEGPYQMEIAQRGAMDNLALTHTARRSLQVGEVEIRVRAAGLNFRDVLNVLGMYPGNPPLGGECAGEIVAIGEGVEGVLIGDAVIAAVPGCFSRYAVVDANEIIPKPAQLTFEEAATIPVVFITAWYALRELGNVALGQRVLIHAASGGVGMAAVQLAQLAGAEVFATASPGKWKFLESLGVKHIMNSRTTEFADQIMEITAGEGVDIVLNSLTSEGFIPNSLSVLRSGGHFLEISAVNAWQPEQVAEFNPELSYSLINLAQTNQEHPELMREMMNDLMRLFETGELKPLPHKVFPINESIGAFRYMQQARHIGKIVLTMPADNDIMIPMGGDGTYLITGGLGGLGLEVAKWMVDKGARNLVLTGRSEPSEHARTVIHQVQEVGAQVRVINADVSVEAQAHRLFQEMDADMPPLKGIIHAAGLLDDGVLLQQDMARFENVMAPKVAGSWILHTLTQDRVLDFFVCFSSMSSLMGSAGQANYASANAFMDALVHYRRQMGLPGISINWGPWASVGMAARMEGDERERNRLGAMGLAAIEPEQGMAYLETLIAQNSITQVGVFPINWSKFLKQLPEEPVFFSELIQEASSAEGSVPIKHRLKQASEEEYEVILADFIRDKLAAILGMNSTQVDVQKPLHDMGLDSLMTIELRNRIRSELGANISIARFMREGTTVLDLVAEVDPQRGFNVKPKEALQEGEEEFDL